MFTVPTPRETIAEHQDCTLDYPRSSRRHPLQRGLMVCAEHGVYVDCRSYPSPGTLAAAALIFPRSNAAVHALADRARCYWTDVLTAWYEAGMPGRQPMGFSTVDTGHEHGPFLGACNQCGATWSTHPAGDGLDECPGDFTSPSPLGTCQWYVLCDQPADHLEPHPFLGFVPACGRCAQVGR